MVDLCIKYFAFSFLGSGTVDGAQVELCDLQMNKSFALMYGIESLHTFPFPVQLNHKHMWDKKLPCREHHLAGAKVN